MSAFREGTNVAIAVHSPTAKGHVTDSAGNQAILDVLAGVGTANGSREPP